AKVTHSQRENLCAKKIPVQKTGRRKKHSKNGTGCGNVGPRTRNQTFPTWSGLRPDTLDTVPETR
ncbi:hypothetical protein U0B34_25725, partial [Escherichia coli]|nr:hypothetical protein [Escherichia coli]